MKQLSLDQALTEFIISLRARNTSILTQQAYQTDVQKFITWLNETSVIATHIGVVSKADIIEYLSYLADLNRSGVTRARKLTSLREFFKYLCDRAPLPVLPFQKRTQTTNVFTA